MEYKRQTREVQYKGRQVDNPGKRLAQENKAYKARDAGMMKEWSQRSREYGIALDEWNQNLAAKDKEVVDFWKTVTPAATKLLSETVPNAMKVKAEMDDDKAIAEYNALSYEEQVKVKNQALSLFNESDDTYDRRADLQAEAERLGYTEYAALLGKLNKRGDTRIFRELIKGELADYKNQLKLNLSDSEEKYTMIGPNGEEIRFSGVDVGDDPVKLKHFLEQNKLDFYRRVQAGGIDTKLIASVTNDKIDSWNTDFGWQEGNRIRINNANEEIHKITSNLPVDISMAMGSNAEGGLSWNLEGELAKDGTPITINDKMSNIVLKLKKQAQLANKTNPTGYAKDQFAKGLHQWVLSLDPDNQEAGWEAVDDILGTYGNVEGMTVIMPNGMSFAQMDNGRFGANGNWKDALGVNRNTTITGNDLSQTDKTQKARLIGVWTPDISEQELKKIKKGSTWEAENPLVDIQTGTLNVKWKGTWQYQLAEAARSGDAAKLEQVRNEALKDLEEKNITDPLILAKVHNWVMPKDTKSTQAYLLKNWDDLIVGKEIPRSALAGLDQSEATIEFLRGKGITVVDEVIGSNGGISIIEDMIYNELEPIGGNGFTAGKESILDDIREQVILAVQNDERYGTVDENVLLKEWTNDILKEKLKLEMANEDSAWYINRTNGQTPNKFKGAWWNPKTRNERNQQLREAESRTNGLLRSKDITSENHEFFDQKQIKSIVEKYNKNGSIDFSVLNTISISGEDYFTAINNQIALANKKDPSLKLEPIVPNETMNEFLNAFDTGDIQTIYKLNGNKGSNTPSITAARIINDKVNDMIGTKYSGWRRKESHILPKQTSILSTLESASDGTVSSDQNGRLGIYAIPETYLQANVKGFDKNKFLTDKQYQIKTVKTLISKETERQFQIFQEYNEGDIYSSSGPSDQDHFINYRDGSVLVRNILHTLSTGTPIDASFYAALQNDKIDLETFNNNTNLLQIYANNFSGGFVPRRTNPNYY